MKQKTIEQEGGSKGKDWRSIVEEYVTGTKFGVIQITVHEGRVVQIDRTEKTRLDAPPVR